jgi:hypothetical protein
MNLRNTSTSRTSSAKAAYKKEVEKEIELKGTPKTLMSFVRKQKLGGGNSRRRLKRDQVEHLWG